MASLETFDERLDLVAGKSDVLPGGKMRVRLVLDNNQAVVEINGESSPCYAATLKLKQLKELKGWIETALRVLPESPS